MPCCCCLFSPGATCSSAFWRALSRAANGSVSRNSFSLPATCSSTWAWWCFQDDALAAHYLVKVVTYVFIYFYSSNMFRNLHLLMPGNPVIRFLDYFVGLQFVRRVPVLEEFLQRAEQEKVSGADAASRNFSSVSAEDTPEDTCGTVDERSER